jgi:hypothetical protein
MIGFDMGGTSTGMHASKAMASTCGRPAACQPGYGSWVLAANHPPNAGIVG